MKSSPEERAVSDLIRGPMETAGFRVVRVKLSGAFPNRSLQVMAERLNGKDITLDECVMINGLLDPLLEQADPVQGAYRLEVSSAGIDRPLMCAEDFRRFAGHEAKVELSTPLDGRKRFRGRLQTVSGEAGAEQVEMVVDNQLVRLPLGQMATAQLVLTDALIRAHQETNE